MEFNQIKNIIREKNIRSIDLKYPDLNGRWYHITFPARNFDKVIKNGIPFDGSSIPGMKPVESGDMVMMPDINTAIIDPFLETPTLRMLCYICDADTRIGTKKDPRSVAKRALDYLKSTNIADEILFIPEFEFYLFDRGEFINSPFQSGYSFYSIENKKSLPKNYEDILGLSKEHCKGYHLDTPFDRYAHIRQLMVDILEDAGLKIRYHHHEVGLSGQQEIETELTPFPEIADWVMLVKDVVRQTSIKNGLTSTFMPKPLYQEAGNGMHFHIMLKKNNKNIFYKKGEYADLSKEAQYFIGGILYHGESLTAFTNPSTNSYKRLLPGFEAPTKLFFGLANRSAAIRIPKYATTEKSKRIEFRTSDATCNPYLAMSALLMAGIDGIKNKIDPKKHYFGPFDQNVFSWSEKEKNRLKSIPESLEESLLKLENDNNYLLEGDVFNKQLIKSWIYEKRKEIESIKRRPHPFEMELYYNI